jgi:hypothetical protein
MAFFSSINYLVQNITNMQFQIQPPLDPSYSASLSKVLCSLDREEHLGLKTQLVSILQFAAAGDCDLERLAQTFPTKKLDEGLGRRIDLFCKV